LYGIPSPLSPFIVEADLAIGSELPQNLFDRGFESEDSGLDRHTVAIDFHYQPAGGDVGLPTEEAPSKSLHHLALPPESVVKIMG
jgi:hypothetical protein